MRCHLHPGKPFGRGQGERLSMAVWPVTPASSASRRPLSHGPFVLAECISGGGEVWRARDEGETEPVTRRRRSKCHSQSREQVTE